MAKVARRASRHARQTGAPEDGVLDDDDFGWPAGTIHSGGFGIIPDPGGEPATSAGRRAQQPALGTVDLDSGQSSGATEPAEVGMDDRDSDRPSRAAEWTEIGPDDRNSSRSSGGAHRTGMQWPVSAWQPSQPSLPEPALLPDKDFGPGWPPRLPADDGPTWLGRTLSGERPEPDDNKAYHGRRRSRPETTVTVVLAVGALAIVVATVAFVPALRKAMPGGRAGSGAAAAVASVSPTPVTFRPLTIEAELTTNTLTGSAAVIDYPGASGGKLVHNLGNFGGTAGSGALRFNDVTVPATGDYAMTFYFVNPDNESTRSVVITASGMGSFTVVLAGGNVCCVAQTVQVFLVKGGNSITFANPQGHAPAIDRIVISRL